ncbi:peptide MFS transporter [Acinetobacter larvae]|uniref:MFS transporter n=1 Tax=Acinetobacter larvae TaxID=1789224 RepID=A0A1B2LX71_9GAMM|nr:peptide MFS transporter [Acinetobacter larvae]AOA57531.1 MFS transporter [Acinetobacter larvae]
MEKESLKDDHYFFGHPRPLQSLFFTELWERFSFYGVRPLLILYMTAMVLQGGLGIDRESAAAIVGLFAGSMYLATIFGGWLADYWLGQAKAVWYGSIIIAAGHLSIGVVPWMGLGCFYLGLVLIVIGSGLFKTCISVMVGLLYQAQDTRRDAGFSIFYMGINIGAFLAPLFTGFFAQQYGWHLGFATGGVGMLIALVIFRLFAMRQLKDFDQKRGLQSNWNQPVKYHPWAAKLAFIFIVTVAVFFIAIRQQWLAFNPVIVVSYFTVLTAACILLYFVYLLIFAKFNKVEKLKIFNCLVLLIVAALFWAAFEQAATSFNLFAEDYTNRELWGFIIPTVWFQSINPIFIVIFAPVIAWLWMYLGKNNKEPNYINKFIMALYFTIGGLLFIAIASYIIAQGYAVKVSPWWLVMTYLFLTFGELCLSPVGLSSMTKLAPDQIRGQIMGLWFAATALGNLLASLIGGQMASAHIRDLPMMFIYCAIVLLIVALCLWLLSGRLQAYQESSS